MKSGGDNPETAGDKNSVDNSALSGLFSLPPAQLTLLASVLGLLFMDGLELGQQNVLGNFFLSLGQTIATAASQGELIKDSTDPATQMQRQIQSLRKQVEALEKKVGRH